MALVGRRLNQANTVERFFYYEFKEWWLLINNIEKAIKTAKENYRTACHDNDGDNPDYEREQLNFYEVAIQALTKMAEREKGCKYCNGEYHTDFDTYIIRHHYSSSATKTRIDTLCCPNCGHDLRKDDNK